MCAGVAGQLGQRILLVDHNGDPGRKILISGGGRCNFTNLETSADRFLSANPHFAKSALGRYSAQDFVDLVERHDIAWHEKTLGQLFCDGSAKQIVAMLLAECPREQVDFAFGISIESVRKSGVGFELKLSDSRIVESTNLIVATGGPSIPKIGATGFAYELAEQFDITLEPTRPALVPLTLAEQDRLFQDLSGVSTPVTASSGKTSFDEAALFTHRGLSGPAILQISSYWQPDGEIKINFIPTALPGWLIQAKQNTPKLSLAKVLNQYLPVRLSQALAMRVPGQSPIDALGGVSDKRLESIEKALADWLFIPNGTEGYAKAEVTAGGISTGELSSRTLETKTVKGLYFIGEAVDVTGWLGGYNFQWAWASGYAAAHALATNV